MRTKQDPRPTQLQDTPKIDNDASFLSLFRLQGKRAEHRRSKTQRRQRIALRTIGILVSVALWSHCWEHLYPSAQLIVTQRIGGYGGADEPECDHFNGNLQSLLAAFRPPRTGRYTHPHSNDTDQQLRQSPLLPGQSVVGKLQRWCYCPGYMAPNPSPSHQIRTDYSESDDDGPCDRAWLCPRLTRQRREPSRPNLRPMLQWPLM
jgi:hypothetical protein